MASLFGKILGGLVLAAAAGGAVFWFVTEPKPLPESAFAGLSIPDVVNGERLFWASGCASCHAPKGAADKGDLTLSGGEQQRVQLARVLAQVWEQKSFPRFVLLDEPTSSLDIAQQQMIFSLVKQACERNIGVLAIVHDLNQAVQFADQLYFMREGTVIAQGETKAVFTKPIIEETFCCRVNVYHDPCTNCPYIVPDKTNISTLKTVTI